MAGARPRGVHRRGAQDQRRQVRQEGPARALPLSGRSWALRTALDLEGASAALGALEPPGLLGITEEGGLATLWLRERVEDLPLDGVWEAVPEVDWNAAWKAGIEPVTVGRITVVPPWLEPPAGADRVLVIDPGMAFGTGHHETTTSCLRALQEVALGGLSVLDVGTGTGILALAARLLGAAAVLGVDSDPDAVAVARANADAHGLDIAVQLGSADAAEGRWDVVVANLDAASLPGLAGDLAARLAPEGTLIASGIGLDLAPAVARTLRAEGLAVDLRPGREWALLRCHHQGPASSGSGSQRGTLAQGPGVDPGP